jgi:DNA-binding IscR family transcriptional regulator
MPVSVVEEQVDELIGHGILCRMMDPEGIGLVKPPELIPITDVLQVIRHGEPAGTGLRHESGGEVKRLLDCRDQAVKEALAGITLRSLVVDSHQEPQRSQESTAQAS